MLQDAREADETPTINMMPMVDVILCLLIFFMTATRLYDWDENEFRVTVPTVEKARPLTSAPSDLDLVIVEAGRVRLGDAELNLSELGEELRRARERYPEQGLLIRGDGRLSYQDVADVLSVCEGARLRNVRLAVRPRGSGAEGP